MARSDELFGLPHLSKPFRQQQLAALIKKLLDQTSRRPRSAPIDCPTAFYMLRKKCPPRAKTSSPPKRRAATPFRLAVILLLQHERKSARRRFAMSRSEPSSIASSHGRRDDVRLRLPNHPAILKEKRYHTGSSNFTNSPAPVARSDLTWISARRWARRRQARPPPPLRASPPCCLQI